MSRYITASDASKRAGANLREQRLADKVSLVDLSHRTGIAYSTLQSYERGYREISLGVLYRLARVYEMPVSRILEEAA